MSHTLETPRTEPAPPPAGKANRLRAYLVPLLLTIVAAVQIVRVHFDGLNSWRGGGFGMYAGFHPRHHDVWLLRTDTGDAFRYEKTGRHNTGPHAASIRPNLTHPNQRRLDATRQNLPTPWREHARLQVWRLAFDPGTGQLTRQLLVQSPDNASHETPDRVNTTPSRGASMP